MVDHENRTVPRGSSPIRTTSAVAAAALLLGAAAVWTSPAPTIAGVPEDVASAPLAANVTGPAHRRGAAITLQPSRARPGHRVVATGAGFQAFEALTVDLVTSGGVTTKAVTAADAGGAFRARFRVPLATPAGDWSVSVSGATTTVAATAPLVVRTNWNQFQRGRGHHGFNRYERVLTKSTAPDLVPAWRQPTPSACTSYSSPTVVEKRLFVGDYCGTVAAYDAVSGLPVWTAATDGKVDSTPAVAGGRVFVATGSPGRSMYALSVQDGHQLWRYEMSSGVLSSPVLRNGILYQAATDGSVYAVNAATGGAVWRAQLPKVDGDLASTPVVGADTLYVGSNDGFLYALSIRDGSVRWSGDARDAPEPVVVGSPALSGQTVLVGTSRGLVAFAADGCGATPCTPAWRSFTMLVSGALAVAYGYVYLTDDEGTLWSFDARGCGAPLCYQRWHTILGGGGSGSGGPTVAGRAIYVTTSFTNTVTAVDPLWGDPVWSFSDPATQYPGNTRVTVVNQTVYATLTWSRAYVAFRLPAAAARLGPSSVSSR